MSAPLVRDEHGAILGIDWRRTPAGKHQVPGPVPAEFVQPGDGIVVEGVPVTVYMRLVVLGVVHIFTRTAAGGELTIERDPGETVQVVSAGAFDR